jgi:protein-S-isoprenylcysteine O-methyltransferase Ste14
MVVAAVSFAVFALGLNCGALLIGMLLVTIAKPTLRLWPTPGDKSLQSYVWWPLFRGLNVLCVVMSMLDRPGGFFGLPSSLRIAAAVVCIGSIGVFVFAFTRLGRANSYGASEGLVTSGIYQWSRNPQNAMLMLVYASLAFAVDGIATAILCALMILVYALMVFAEEPWLSKVYGDAYRHYCAGVSRFFHWRRLFG